MKLNLLGAITTPAYIARLTRNTDRIALALERLVKLQLIQAGITPGMLDEAEAWEPREHPIAVMAANLKDKFGRVTPKTPAHGMSTPDATPVVLNQGDDLAKLQDLEPGSPEWKAEVARQLSTVPRATAAEYLSPDDETLLRFLGAMPDDVGGGPMTSGSGSGGLPPRPPEE